MKKRGQLYRVQRSGKADPKRFRTFVIVSRQGLIDSNFRLVICAPVYTNGYGLATQVEIGIEEGMKHSSWITCDELVSLDKAELTFYVGSLGPEKIRQLNRALKSALALNGDSFLIQ